ncbi:hypothetical protein GU926_03200 [Nibribacter ruber]|uniref:Uncharacterized protein n=1 Tax=Nibribacter ruber TaxID=2698458 RepID=A0A6P1NTY3_9BACT|nr:hypothetical protein [Nibribacter ruber]QHL86500.1 hypothetical protein GU926_03200 [Nibribacter ruber]
MKLKIEIIDKSFYIEKILKIIIFCSLIILFQYSIVYVTRFDNIIFSPIIGYLAIYSLIIFYFVRNGILRNINFFTTYLLILISLFLVNIIVYGFLIFIHNFLDKDYKNEIAKYKIEELNNKLSKAEAERNLKIQRNLNDEEILFHKIKSKYEASSLFKSMIIKNGYCLIVSFIITLIIKALVGKKTFFNIIIEFSFKINYNECIGFKKHFLV